MFIAVFVIISCVSIQIKHLFIVNDENSYEFDIPILINGNQSAFTNLYNPVCSIPSVSLVGHRDSFKSKYTSNTYFK